MDWPTEVVEAPVPGLDPRVRRFRLGDEVDVYVLVTDRLLVVVDTLSTPADARQLRAAIEPLLDGRRLVVVNTHADWDHAWGNQVFADALVVASRACAERLAGADFTAAMTQMRAEMPGRFDEVVATVPDLAVDGTFALDGGDLVIELVPTPGHTVDHLSLHLPALGVLLAADAAEWPWPHVPDGPGLVEARASLVRLQGLAPAVVLPCHGGEHGPELLAANIAYLDAVVADPEMTLEAAAAMAGTTAAALPELYVAFHRDACAAGAALR
jgi:glyoxylase-like metal-dependent hydrolase (beta-lactamase superfamily II)